jgi:hypothetical protein
MQERPRLAVVLCAVALGAALLAAYGFERDPNPDARRGELISGQPAPAINGPRLAESDVPREAPFVGEPGNAADGYPWRRPDKVKLLGMLRLRRYDELDRFFAFYQDAFERDFRHEYWPDQAVAAFYVADPALEPLLNEWVKRSPNSFAAHVARGNYRHRLGWHYRGGKFAKETSRGQFASMEEYFAAARVDLQRALALRPKLVAAYRRLLALDGAGKEMIGRQALLASALAICPLCYEVRATRLDDLQPRWGGSHREMERFATATRPLWSQNPRLRLLTAFADADRCALATRSNELAAAHVACDRALAVGDETRALSAKAHLLRTEHQDAAALQLLDRSLRIEPHDRDALEARTAVRIELGDIAGAASDALASWHLDPTDPHVAKEVKYLVDKLRYDGDQLRKAKKGAQAAKLYSLGLQLAPDDRDLLIRLGLSEKSTDLSAAAIGAQLDAAPDDFELRLRIDAGLAASNRYADVVAMWTPFIAAHPSDPRPLSERAGAHWHLREIGAALADMQRACDLGMTKACSDLRGMRAHAAR